MRELKFQVEIIKSLKEQGGYCNKISDRYKVGVPDLLAAAEGRLVLLELKSLGEVSDNFRRQTGITAIQQETLNKYNATSMLPMGAQLVYIEHRGSKRAVVWPAEWSLIGCEYEKDGLIWVERSRKSPNWDVRKLVKAVELMKFFVNGEELTETSLINPG